MGLKHRATDHRTVKEAFLLISAARENTLRDTVKLFINHTEEEVCMRNGMRVRRVTLTHVRDVCQALSVDVRPPRSALYLCEGKQSAVKIDSVGVQNFKQSTT